MVGSELSGIYADGEAYEKFMGRWSRVSGREFVRWLDRPKDLVWLDVGCGTGAFTKVILEESAPRAVTAMDPSEPHIQYVRKRVSDPRAAFQVGDGRMLGFADRSFDVAVAALVLNFVSDPELMIAEMRRVVRPAGTVATYVWDFEGGRNISQHIWESVARVDPTASILSGNAKRINVGRPTMLSRMFNRAGLVDVATRAIDIIVTYDDFSDYWASNDTPTNPIGKYIKTLPADGYRSLKRKVEEIVPTDEDGSIRYSARAYAVRGLVPPVYKITSGHR